MCGNKGVEMNERIKQLALEAGDYVNEVYTAPVRSKTPGKIWEDGHIDWHTQFNEKFAQLIVKECAKVILETPVEYLEIDAMHRVRDRVKNHFGVEL